MADPPELSLVPKVVKSEKADTGKKTGSPESVTQVICQRCGHINPSTVDFYNNPCQDCGYLSATTYRNIHRGKIDQVNMRLIMAVALVLIIFLYFKLIADPTVKGTDAEYKFTYIEKSINIPDEESPEVMIIALHGYGGNHSNFMTLFDYFDRLHVPVRIIALRGPFNGDTLLGYSWGSTLQNYREVGDSIAASIADLKEEYPTKGKPIVFGSSQGAVMTYYLAMNHPNEFSYAFPIGGYTYPELIPAQKQKIGQYPDIFAFHGGSDTVMPLIKARSTIDALRNLSVDVNLKVYEGVRHEIPLKMKLDIYDQLKSVIEDLL